MFHYTLTVLIESGIYEFVHQANIKLDQSFLSPKYNGTLESDTVLYFADYLPVWMAYALGIVGSLVAFVLEIFNKEIGKAGASWKKPDRLRGLKMYLHRKVIEKFG